MVLLKNDIISLPEAETFYRVENFDSEQVTGGNLADLIFESDYMKTVAREGHM